MNFADLLVLLPIAVALYFAFRYVAKNGVESCDCGCSSCHGSCSQFQKQLKKEETEVDEEKRLGLF